jgi:CHAT domain-containing protein
MPARTRSAIKLRPAPVRKSDIASAIGRGMALVEFVRVRDEDPAALDGGARPEERAVYLAFVLDGAFRLSLVELGPARAIDASASDLQAAIRGGASPALIHELLKELYESVWAPVESFLGEAKRIVVSPDGELYRVPFAALIDRKEQFLIERFRFAYATSGRDLCKARGTGAGPALDLALVADADFGEGDTFARLPATALEARLIPPLIPGAQKVLTGKEATEAAVKQVQSPRVLHIATHGFFLEQDTFGLDSETYEHSLVKSGLALAGANRTVLAAGEDDGLLTALEVTGIDLRATELVVLSSCDSGAGSVTHGQGVLGLRRAFGLAGAKSLLLTLWPVDDAVTAQVMVAFYRNLSRLPAADALHEAQIEALGRIRQRDKYANPSLWAAFLLQSGSAFSAPGK